MKIALVGYEANIKNRVGSNQYAFELMKAIYQLDRKNQYLIYLPNSPLPDLPKERDGWHYKVVGPKKLWNLLGLPLALWQQKPKPDVIFNPGHYSPIFLPAPLVVTIMDLGYLRFPQHFPKLTYGKLKFWTGWSIRRAVHLLTISQTTKNDIMNYYKIDSKKITVTYPGYDEKIFKLPINKLQIEKTKEKYGIKGDYILFLSTLKPSKNVEGLIQAFKSITQGVRCKGLRLVVSGKKGWMFEKIFERVKELDLEDKVLFTDFVEEKDVPALMAGAKVFVLPSFWEGFGIPVLEAMAMGTPVVVSKMGSLPEIVGDAGVVIDPYSPESIAQGIEEALRRKEELTKKGLKQICQFNWLNCAQKTLEVLKNVQR